MMQKRTRASGENGQGQGVQLGGQVAYPEDPEGQLANNSKRLSAVSIHNPTNWCDRNSTSGCFDDTPKSRSGDHGLERAGLISPGCPSRISWKPSWQHTGFHPHVRLCKHFEIGGTSSLGSIMPISTAPDFSQPFVGDVFRPDLFNLRQWS